MEGRSGLGDCTKKNNIGEGISNSQIFCSKMYKKNITKSKQFNLKKGSEK